jgi:hypothetical protein
MKNGLLLSTSYLPPISWFAAIVNLQIDNVLLEKWEHFPKQTYRNRARILSPNGVLDMSIPILKGARNHHTKVKDLKISYDVNWQKVHWKSLESSYRSSAYFEYYEDEFAPLYAKHQMFLLDFNESLLEVIFKCLKTNKKYEFTESYEDEYPSDIIDLRDVIHPKKEPLFVTDKYYQMFAKEGEFHPDLSIVDLLFNHGTRAMGVMSSAKSTIL